MGPACPRFRDEKNLPQVLPDKCAKPRHQWPSPVAAKSPTVHHELFCAVELLRSAEAPSPSPSPDIMIWLYTTSTSGPGGSSTTQRPPTKKVPRRASYFS